MNKRQQELRLAKSIQDQQALKILILSNTQIPALELEALNGCQNLMKLDISSNSIKCLPPSIMFSQLTMLQCLYLHSNEIQDASQLGGVLEIPHLRYLTLFNNPISQKPSIRHFIVNSLPSLYALDFNAVADEERIEQIVSPSSNRFSSHSLHSKINWPLVKITTDPLRATEEVYLKVLQEEMKIITQKYTECSPILYIQRIWRGYYVRKHMHLSSMNIVTKIALAQRIATKWKNHTIKKQDLKSILETRGKHYLLLEGASFRVEKGLSQLRKVFKQHLIKFRERKKLGKAAFIIIRAIKRLRNKINSFSPLLGEIGQPASFFFRRDQLKLLYSIFESSLKYISQTRAESIKIHSSLLASIKNSFADAAQVSQIGGSSYLNQIISFRIADSDTEKQYKNNAQYPYISLVRASLSSKVIFLPASTSSYYSLNKLPFFEKFRKKVHFKNLDPKFNKKKHLSPADIVKMNKIIAHYDIFQNKQYNCLIKLVISDYYVRHALIKAIVVNNYLTVQPTDNSSNNTSNQHKNLFIVLFEKEVQKVSAAIIIQKNYRRYLQRSQLVPIIGQIIFKRASTKIQRWVRKLKWNHRMAFWNNAQFYSSQIKSSNLYLNLEAYMNLLSIVQITQSNQIMIFKEQEAKVTVSPSKGTVRLSWNFENPSHEIYLNKRKKVFPKWLKAEQGLAIHEEVQFGDVMHLINCGTKSKLIVVDGIKYLNIQFSSVYEARYRGLAVGLLTYRFKRNGMFLRFLNEYELNEFHIILKEVSRLQQVYGFNIKYDKSVLDHHIELNICNKKALFIKSQRQSQFTFPSTNYSVYNASTYNQSQTIQQQHKLADSLFIYFLDDIYLYKQNEVIFSVKGKDQLQQLINSKEAQELVLKKSQTQQDANLLKVQDQQWQQQQKHKNKLSDYDFIPSGTTSQIRPSRNANRNLINKRSIENCNTIANDSDRNNSLKFINFEFDSNQVSLKPSRPSTTANFTTSKDEFQSMSVLQTGCVANLVYKPEGNIIYIKRNVITQKEKEQKQLEDKQKIVDERKKNRILAKQIINVEKDLTIKQKSFKFAEQKRERKRLLSLQADTIEEAKIEKVEAVRKQLNSQPKGEEQHFEQNFERSHNFLLKQMIQFNSKQSKAAQHLQSIERVKTARPVTRHSEIEMLNNLLKQERRDTSTDFKNLQQYPFIYSSQKMYSPSRQSQQSNQSSNSICSSSHSQGRNIALINKLTNQNNDESLLSNAQYQPQNEIFPTQTSAFTKIVQPFGNIPNNNHLIHKGMKYSNFQLSNFLPSLQNPVDAQKVGQSLQTITPTNSNIQNQTNITLTNKIQTHSDSMISAAVVGGVGSTQLQQQSIFTQTTTNFDQNKLNTQLTETTNYEFRSKANQPQIRAKSNYTQKRFNTAKVIHAVFPEELYPIQGNSFQLNL